MGPMYYIGLDVHKQKISYCVKDSGGKIHAEGWIPRMVKKLEWIETAQLAVSSILFKSLCRVAGGHRWPPAL